MVGRALATANDVPVSRTVVDIVAREGVDFDDRGEHEMNGVPGDLEGCSQLGVDDDGNRYQTN